MANARRDTRHLRERAFYSFIRSCMAAMHLANHRFSFLRRLGRLRGLRLKAAGERREGLTSRCLCGAFPVLVLLLRASTLTLTHVHMAGTRELREVCPFR